jgi:hypothetical protein
MREWRKVYGEKVAQSDRLAELSFEARWLWLLLTLAQDDEGHFPNTRTKLMALTIGCGWSWDDCQRLTTDCQVAGVVSQDDGFIQITNGVEYNGQFRNDRAPFVYVKPSLPVVNQRGTTDIPVTALARRAESERIGKERIGKDKGSTKVDDDFVAAMVESFSESLGGEQEVRHEIEGALNHKAADRAKNKQLYVRRWLARSIEFRSRNGNARANTTAGRTTDGWREWFPANGGGDSPADGTVF